MSCTFFFFLVFDHCKMIIVVYILSTSSGVQDYYTGNGSNVYYLNNFDSISQSYGKSV